MSEIDELGLQEKNMLGEGLTEEIDGVEEQKGLKGWLCWSGMNRSIGKRRGSGNNNIRI